MLSNISIFIPKLASFTTEDDIKHAFEVWEIGTMDHVDFVEISPNEYRAYVHFTHWYDNENNIELQRKLEAGIPVKKYYTSYCDEDADVATVSTRWDEEDDESDGCVFGRNTFYWVLLKNKTKKFVSGKPKQCINLDGLKPATPPTECVNITTAFVHNDYFAHIYNANIELRSKKNRLLQLSSGESSFPIPYETAEMPESPQMGTFEEENGLIGEDKIIAIENDNARLMKYISRNSVFWSSGALSKRFVL